MPVPCATPDKNPLVLVPLMILDFLCIHPFSDGNGRIARLLTLMLLYHFNYEGLLIHQHRARI